MPRQKIVVEVATPQWKWCELQSKAHRNMKTGERCRFCKEVKERGKNPRYFCLLFNVELNQIGDAVEKTCLCMTNWRHNEILDLDAEPVDTSPTHEASTELTTKDVKVAVREALKAERRMVKDLIKSGIPESTAYEMASKHALDTWR